MFQLKVISKNYTAINFWNITLMYLIHRVSILLYKTKTAAYLLQILV